jgi:L-ascorbate metabolism protein UlaG (beta-lactamase superfamily)
MRARLRCVAPAGYNPRMARLEYVGHSTVLVEQEGTRILTDPLVRERVGYVLRDTPVPRLEDLRDLDAIVISHAHADHLDVPSLKRLAHRGPFVVPEGVAPLLRRAAAQDVIELKAGDRCTIGAVEIEAVHAEHDGRRHPLARQLPALGYLLHGPTRVYFAGDTDLFDEMAALAGRVDVALVPISGWGPRVPEGHLDPQGAARAVALIRPAVAVPIHWGTMRRVALRPGGDAHAVEFAEAVASAAPATDVRVLQPGESMPL